MSQEKLLYISPEAKALIIKGGEAELILNRLINEKHYMLTENEKDFSKHLTDTEFEDDFKFILVRDKRFDTRYSVPDENYLKDRLSELLSSALDSKKVKWCNWFSCCARADEEKPLLKHGSQINMDM